LLRSIRSVEMEKRGLHRYISARTIVTILLVASLCAPIPRALAWSAGGDRFIIGKAIEMLPDDLRPYFDSNRAFLTQHVADAIEAQQKNPLLAHEGYIRFEKYGVFPFTALPRDYKAALQKFSKHSVEVNGLLPWSVGLYSQKLTEEFRSRNWDEARLAASQLAYYVAEAHDPFNTTTNFDGHLSNQTGAGARFDSSLVERYSQFFYLHPGEVTYIHDPTDHAFEMCLTAHSWLEDILLSDRRARTGLSDYTDEYYDRFYGQVGSVLVQQISDASVDVASYWLTSWTNAGKPQLPAH
jgi:hypothetical protein